MPGREIPPALLADVKNYCDITWDDAATDRKVSGLIARGMARIDGWYGGPADYEAEDAPRALLMDYVRYGRDGALDVFENNFRAEILAMQHDKAVSDYAENALSTEQ